MTDETEVDRWTIEQPDGTKSVLILTKKHQQAVAEFADSLLCSMNLSVGEALIHAKRFAAAVVTGTPMRWKGGGEIEAADMRRLFSPDNLIPESEAGQ